MSDIGFDETSEYYENTEIFTGLRTVRVLVENIQDADIWSGALPEKENLNFEYATPLNLDIANELELKKSEGCSQLDKIQHYKLGKNLIICKDSDYTYIEFLMRTIISGNSSNANIISDYIFETIVHSKENIIFFKDYVLKHFANRIFSHTSSLPTKAPWISIFYEKFSNLIFNSLIKTIYHDFILHKDIKIQQIGFYKLNGFTVHMKNIPMRNITDFNNFFSSKLWKRIESELSDYEKNLDKIVSKHGRKPELEKILLNLTSYGICKEDIYNFYRGHDVEDIFNFIISRYLDIVYENEISSICAKLDQDQVKSKTRELENAKRQFDVIHEIRDLKQHSFFNQTFIRLEKLYE